MAETQRTIAKPASLQGIGLFTSKPSKVNFKPAPENHGVVFCCLDQESVHIPAHVAHVVKRPRRTSLQFGKATIETCEHCLSAVAAMGLDNLLIEVEGPELPGMDGSALPFYEALKQAGTEDADQPRRVLTIRKPIMVRHDDAMITALPPEPGVEGLDIFYELDYRPRTEIGRQVCSFNLARDGYVDSLASARTFLLEEEALQAREAGIGTHLTEDDVLVLGPEGPLGNNKLRFVDEPVRHKMVDLIGDLFLLGIPIHGRILAQRSGHALNHALVRQLLDQARSEARLTALAGGRTMDIRGLMRLLPHRYPMLLVDRVLEIDGSRRALGVKNVTINEPFFTGHYPGSPIMPGVLIVEAMAQLSGVVICQILEHEGKLAILLSLDNVRLRKPVTPGDQLVLEAETVRVRARIAHMRCRAYVGEETAAEAEVKFMLVDDDSQS
ncbi:MAG: UDP-3-O-[3-hydroxymyristoyl] N-acetylglucosamine deacetylase [Phycisphaeraceae bacterium]|nr:UDP-3-O-[3-hydroxymyristoyl] N-acetylglucosamine deacetylase [Phycisphaeraceae bacterium]